MMNGSKIRRVWGALAAFLITTATLAGPPVGAQSGGPSDDASDKAARGLAPQAREFDFWFGRWNLIVTGGAPATSSITPFGLGGGIAVLEDYRQGTYQGTSVSYYSPKDHIWRQLWLDTQDSLLEFEGAGMQNNKFVIEGNVGATRTRLVYYNIKNNAIDQDYDLSTNDGVTWTNNFRAHYARTGARGTASEKRSPGQRVLPNASRQFDFWLGTWDVLSEPNVTATDSVSTYGLGGGIAVLQSLTATNGYQSSSVAMYHVQRRFWNLLWLDSNGVVMDLSGGIKLGTMVLEGTITDPNTGLDARARMSFNRISDRQFDQVVEVSQDNGETWTVRSTNHYGRGALPSPTDFQATKVKKKKVILSWADAATSETGYELLRKDGEDWTVIDVLAPDTTTTTVKGLSRRTAYTFGIRVCDAFGCSEPTELTVTTK